MTADDIITLSSVNGGLFLTIIILIIIYRLDYFQKIDQLRIDREIIRLDKKYQVDIVKYGITSKKEID